MTKIATSTQNADLAKKGVITFLLDASNNKAFAAQQQAIRDEKKEAEKFASGADRVLPGLGLLVALLWA